MNVYFITDKTNGNYLTRTNKWTPVMYKAHIFTSIATAGARRSIISKKQNKKLHVETYQLSYIGDH